MSLDLRTILIANPRAGAGTLGQRWSSVAAALTRQLGSFHHRFTSAQGDAVALTRQAIADGFELIVAVGGDGTINEVLNGFFEPNGEACRSAALGVLHFGTGGDFCRTAGFARRLRAGAEALGGTACRPLDVGRVTYVAHDGSTGTRHFANISSFGLSGAVDELVNRSSKALGGRVGFALATVQAMRQYRAPEAELRLDGGPPRRVKIEAVAVANGQYFGGGMRVAPRAQLDDGLLDVVVIEELSGFDLIRHGHRIYRGTHLDLPFVHFSQAKRLEARPIDPAARILLDIDGEAPGRLPATFELLPAAVQLKCRDSASRGSFARPAKDAGLAADTADEGPTGARDGRRS